MSRKKKQAKSLEELVEEALVPEEEQPYKVPENWVWVRLGSLSLVTGGGTPKSKNEEYYSDEGGIPWITPADLSGYRGKYISKGRRNITKLGFENSSTKILPKYSLLLSSRAPVGYVALAAKDLCTNQGFKSFPPTRAYKPDFGYWYLRYAKRIIESYSSGTTFKEISGSKATKIPFPLPPLPEQKRIVNRVESLLEKVDEAKQLIEEARETFEQRRAAILSRSFRGELTQKWREKHSDVEPVDQLLERIREEKTRSAEPKRARKKVTDLPPIDPPYELPERWKWVRLADIVESTTYGTSAKANDEGGTPVLRMGNIQQGEIDISNIRYLPTDHPDVKKYTLETNDLLFNRTNSIEHVGKTGMVSSEYAGEMTFASYLVRVRLFDKIVLAPYVCNYINSADGRGYLLSTVTQQVGQANINAKKLLSLPVPLPPTGELIQINSLLKKISEAEEKSKGYLAGEETIDSLTQSILSRAFRGKLGTNDPQEESALELLKETLAEQHGFTYERPQNETLQVAEQGALFTTS
ncbi:restriction endonuclease subunit S [Salinithrix halophila]|uniref:Restriction endonuclease subunit S n=1 Tax=Salinithrix halophila TaxID=1485204 RepID=A0ABV8JG15_9BACL